MDKRDEIIKLFSLGIRNILGQVNVDYEKLQEIRLRINSPLIIVYDNKEFFINVKGELETDKTSAYYVSKNELKETMEYISNFSLYAFEEEIRQGFITVQGGHRVGITGKTVVEGGKVRSIKHISFINIRLSHQIRGCSDPVLPHITCDDGIYHTIIISPPRCGKTTLLRDLIRQISSGSKYGKGISVGVVDERSEIGACYLGMPQNDLGIRTDVLDCCPKAEGMLMLIRSMSPRVIAVDEIGSKEDIDAIEYVINCGCKLICTVHGQSIEDIEQKPVLNKLIHDKIFERYIVLSNKNRIGQIVEIYDRDKNPIFSRG